ncbi:MAG: ATP-dependent Clp protease proteolytic subunit [SAR324 cluster bacterium]|jgi:ATP-dependent Clp protease protease subunit|uniref:endopeptidase Clp n=1 Tax=marine metagenome TaxID=408172 RepID=A0A382E803_9ZZZZ|nr:ATP-dependent Clp protease proteolytic subunit [Deltaproteobacteria bacterium]MDP6093774.1 ATP-dependent Clp protease proteolytic subunit [SAR324 cluster bacterium]MDP6245488.1 ATP-dependent Clp protease proteolytic subunit [SAR324 cluster bacterium]MDP6331135.1 ATP-dependent Clp protease proteolytic subunit [SAR324 cluster bacterium]MDP6465072.1 ATP-dependent Clp protease proteolytic subunit [SAR324 cluster bacterium]|tara:strand:+ start:301 stop:933 length:633 start_codon:yes stop_codon:yes gene_type:complete
MTPFDSTTNLYSETVFSSNDSKQKEDNNDLNGMSAKLLKSRTVIISQQVNSELSAKVLNQLVLLEQEDPKQGITVFINSPGGEIFSGFAIFDTLRFIECPITTVVTGFAASMGSVLSLAADEGRRFAMPQAKIMIHQPMLMGYQGRAADCEIQAKEILKTRDHLINLYSEQTGRDYEEIKQAIDRDNWFTAQEALEFGLLDSIVKNRSEL